MEFGGLVSLFDKFPDEKSCREYLAKQRWNGVPICPHCEHTKIYIYKDGRLYKCAKCRRQFTVTVGTIFEDSHIPLRKWFLALYIATNHKKGISSLQLCRDIGVTQKTAWFMMHRIREIFRPVKKKLSGTLEMDETYIGGKIGNMHKQKRPENTSVNYKDKTPVFGILQRNGNIISMPVKNTSKETLHAIIKQNVRKGSKIITDEHRAYQGLNENYLHRFIVHSMGEYAIGVIHTNTIEGFWSLLKRGIIGIYHQISPKHLHRYCNEFTYRYNTKDITDPYRFANTLGKCEGRLTYQGLIQ